MDVAPDHASLYLLELYPNAPLKETMARAGWSLAPDDDAAEMYLWSMGGSMRPATVNTRYRMSRGRAQSRGTISSTGRTASGSGSGAARIRPATAFGGRMSPRPRTTFSECVEGRALPVENAADCTALERAEEALFTGLRLAGGVDIAAVGARYGLDAWGRFGAGPRAVHRGGDGPP